MDACMLPLHKCETVMVEGEDVDSILDGLEHLELSDRRIMININGGTKLMALAAYATITGTYPSAEVYYLPLHGRTMDQVAPVADQVDVTVELSLQQYLTAHNLTIKGSYRVSTIPPSLGQQSRNILKHILRTGVAPNNVRNACRRKYKQPDKPFLMGGWLELYVAGAIRNLLDLDDDHIAYNIRLTRTQADDNEMTEYDVMYIYQNRLFVVECKYFSRQNFSKRKILKDWYKLAGLRQDFGVTCTPYFATANTLLPAMRAYLDRVLPHYGIAGALELDTLSNKIVLRDYLLSI